MAAAPPKEQPKTDKPNDQAWRQAFEKQQKGELARQQGWDAKTKKTMKGMCQGC